MNTWLDNQVDAVRDAIVRGDLISAAPDPPAGGSGPVNGGGAFWYLNGLSPEDIIRVLLRLTPAERGQLSSHIEDAVGRFDVPRLRVALSAATAGQSLGPRAVENLDAVRAANPPSTVRAAFDNAVASGNWTEAWHNLTGLNMYEMTHSLEGIGDARRTELWGHRPTGDISRAEYARSVVEERQNPAAASGDLEATGQVATAADFVAEQLFHVAAAVNPEAMPHISHLLQACAAQGITDKSHVAYVLASAHWESSMGRAMVESHSGAAYEGRADLCNTHPGDGPRYKGRGYVQITGRCNYRQYSTRLGVDLIANPGLATDPANARRIAADGMLHGRFTGRSLGQFGVDGAYDFVNAREIVNGHNHDTDIAAIARRYRAAMNRP